MADFFHSSSGREGSKSKLKCDRNWQVSVLSAQYSHLIIKDVLKRPRAVPIWPIHWTLWSMFHMMMVKMTLLRMFSVGAWTCWRWGCSASFTASGQSCWWVFGSSVHGTETADRMVKKKAWHAFVLLTVMNSTNGPPCSRFRLHKKWANEQSSHVFQYCGLKLKYYGIVYIYIISINYWPKESLRRAWKI